MSTVIFLLFSCITGFVEVGMVIYALSNGFSIIQVLFLVLAYQLGCFFPENLKLAKKYIICLALISVALFSVNAFVEKSYILLLLSILFISPCLQMVRGLNKQEIKTGIKRVSRIIGFALSPFFGPIVMLLVCFLVLWVCIYCPLKNDNKIKFYKIKFPYLIMIFHQMHYFSYVYMILFLSMRIDKINGFLTSLIFVLGWITYTLTPYILNKKNYIVYFLVGHTTLSVILFIMASESSLTIIFILWVLTGFGGGTVFCIKEIFMKFGDYDKKALDTSENYGHVLGLLCGVMVYSICRSINVVIFFAGLYTVIAVFMMIIYSSSKRREKITND